MAVDLIAGATVFVGRTRRKPLQNVDLNRHFTRIGNDLQRNFYHGSIWIIWWISRFSCENMNGQSRQRQHRIAENNVPAVASVEQLEDPVFEIGCKLRAAGKSGQAGSAWRRGIVKGDKLSPLTEVLIRGNWNLREICETAVRHLENIKNSEKQKSKKDS